MQRLLPLVILIVVACLGSAPALAQTAPGPSSSDVAEAASAPVISLDPELAMRLRDQERLRAIEAALAQLRADGYRKDQALANLQARAAKVSRYDDSVVHVLFGLCAVLAAGLLWLLALRQIERRRVVLPGTVAVPGDQEPAERPDPPPAPDEQQPGPAAVTSSPGALADAPAMAVPEARPPAPEPPVPPPAPAFHPSRSGVREPFPELARDELRRPMSSAELIDLEQQVEFYMVLGQDEAAIDLLMGHVRSTSGVSPLPYLKLMEIYRRRGDEASHERIRERFNRRFNGYAPGWEIDPEVGETLEDHPEVLASLQGRWHLPSRSMDLLDDMMFRRDVGPTFEVPAYRELLFLYGIARDLAERDIPEAGVDLLLPLGEESVPVYYLPAQSSLNVPMIDEPLTLDLDVSTDQQPTQGVELPAHAGVDAGGSADETAMRRNPG